MLAGNRIGRARIRDTVDGLEITIPFRFELPLVVLFAGYVGFSIAAAIKIYALLQGGEGLKLPEYALAIMCIVWMAALVFLGYHFGLQLFGREVILMNSRLIRISQWPWSIRRPVEYPLATVTGFRVVTDGDEIIERLWAWIQFRALNQTVTFGKDLEEKEAIELLDFLCERGLLEESRIQKPFGQ